MFVANHIPSLESKKECYAVWINPIKRVVSLHQEEDFEMHSFYHEKDLVAFLQERVFERYLFQ